MSCDYFGHSRHTDERLEWSVNICTREAASSEKEGIMQFSAPLCLRQSQQQQQRQQRQRQAGVRVHPSRQSPPQRMRETSERESPND